MNFTGTVMKLDDDFFVVTKDERVKQKVYPLYKGMYFDNQELEFELIPNNLESDEQVEYTARPTLFSK
jgi:hypothetical protein